LAMVVCALPSSPAAVGPSVHMRPVETPQQGRDTAVGSPRIVQAMASSMLSGAAPTPSRSVSSAAPCREGQSLDASIGQFEDRTSPSVTSSPQISKVWRGRPRPLPSLCPRHRHQPVQAHRQGLRSHSNFEW
jgi:hypothetical protein